MEFAKCAVVPKQEQEEITKNRDKLAAEPRRSRAYIPGIGMSSTISMVPSGVMK
jgi:hypothetical protein